MNAIDTRMLEFDKHNFIPGLRTSKFITNRFHMDNWLFEVTPIVEPAKQKFQSIEGSLWRVNLVNSIVEYSWRQSGLRLLRHRERF